MTAALGVTPPTVDRFLKAGGYDRFETRFALPGMRGTHALCSNGVFAARGPALRYDELPFEVHHELALLSRADRQRQLADGRADPIAAARSGRRPHQIVPDSSIKHPDVHGRMNRVVKRIARRFGVDGVGKIVKKRNKII